MSASCDRTICAKEIPDSDNASESSQAFRIYRTKHACSLPGCAESSLNLSSAEIRTFGSAERVAWRYCAISEAMVVVRKKGYVVYYDDRVLAAAFASRNY